MVEVHEVGRGCGEEDVAVVLGKNDAGESHFEFTAAVVWYVACEGIG